MDRILCARFMQTIGIVFCCVACGCAATGRDSHDGIAADGAGSRVTGLGGVFFKAKDPDKLRLWYAKHLGLKSEEDGVVRFRWREAGPSEDRAWTVWSPFPADTRYFEPSAKPYMFNYRVTDLDALLDRLRKEGVAVEDQIREYDYGRFGWIMDPEGNRIELWEPADVE